MKTINRTFWQWHWPLSHFFPRQRRTPFIGLFAALSRTVIMAAAMVSLFLAQPLFSMVAPVQTGDELVDLPDNECDLLAYLTQLAELRGEGAPQSTSVSAPGNIDGTVLREGTTESIAGVAISAGSYKTTTDKSGHFTLNNVPSGTRTVTAQFDGYFALSRCGSSATIASAQVTVAARETVHVKMGLIPGATIRGTVYDEMGVPRPAAPIRVYRITVQDGSRTLQQMAHTAAQATDNHGNYRIDRIPPGDYYLAAGPGSQLDSENATSITIKGGEEITGANISMRTGGGSMMLKGAP